MDAHIDGEPFPMWTRVHIRAGQRLKIGKTTGAGCRAYLAIYGGLLNVASYFGSKSTSPLVGIGGYQGRQLAPGDLLAITENLPESSKETLRLPDHLIPTLSNEWEVMAMVGPHDEGYFLPEDIEMIYSTKWKISHNASRSGVRLVGPVPKWARKDGGQGGAHPSNLVEYGYPLGTLNWTGDEPCIFPVDCPNFGGFVSSTTIIRADWWKLGQLKAGDTMQYKRVSLEEALEVRIQNDGFLNSVEAAIRSSSSFEGIRPISAHFKASGDYGKAVLWEKAAEGNQPQVRYRQGGDDHLIVEYGDEDFDLNHRCRVTALEKALHAPSTPSWLKDNLTNTVGCCTALMLFYNGLDLPRDKLVHHLQTLESQLGDLSTTKVQTRRFKLPISFTSREQEEATKRYMETQRPHAPYLPDNLAFVAKNNALTPEQLKSIYLTGTFMAVEVGFFCGNTVSLPVDPRHRLSCPKQNPSRVFTPAGTVSWGGSCMSLYPVDSPGGYQMTGRTIPCFDLLGWKRGFNATRPWLFEEFDLLTYYEVGEEELQRELSRWKRGEYEFLCQEEEFDVGAHNDMLRETRDEVVQIREERAKAQDRMNRAEEESLARWREEKAKTKVDEGTVDALLAGEWSYAGPFGVAVPFLFLFFFFFSRLPSFFFPSRSSLLTACEPDPAISTIEAPVDANVWKIQVAEGQQIGTNDVVVILEAMKLEIAVKMPDDRKSAKVEKLLVTSGVSSDAAS